MKVPEYMATGMAVVAPRMPNVADLVDDGRTGVLFTPEDPGSLARALGELARSPERRYRLAAAARQEILDHRSWERVAARVLGSLEELRTCA
jgi:glycosyltransferase involved in cell wall biosynthesis